MFSARVVPSGLTRGDVVDEVAFAGEPPGIATTVQWFGFKRNTKFEQTFLTGDIADEVEVAIDWLLTAQASFDPVQQVMCCWIGLEALAPEVAGPWRCPKCGRGSGRVPPLQRDDQRPQGRTSGTQAGLRTARCVRSGVQGPVWPPLQDSSRVGSHRFWWGRPSVQASTENPNTSLGCHQAAPRNRNIQATNFSAWRPGVVRSTWVDAPEHHLDGRFL